MLGVDIYGGFGVIAGVEAGMDDIGSLLSKTSESSISIEDLVSIILKFGLTFKF
jgi:hypothetical protein